MKRHLPVILAALCVALCLSATDKRNMYVWQNDGTIEAFSAESVDSIKFSGSRLFSVFYSDQWTATSKSIGSEFNVSLNAIGKTLKNSIEIGVCYSSETSTPTCSNSCIVLGSESNKDYAFSIDGLTPSTRYYYRGYVKLVDETFYGEVMSITTTAPEPVVINGHKFIDLGLPSGLLWAETNVGADNDYDYGDYFAWAEVDKKTAFYWSNYKYGYSGNISKYNASDGLEVLEASDDAATANWGTGCRIPTYKEIYELYMTCDWTWESDYNGVSGFLCTGKYGNTIFFPAAGSYYDDDLERVGEAAYFWSSTVADGNYDSACSIFYFNTYRPGLSIESRRLGFSVRPVADKP